MTVTFYLVVAVSETGSHSLANTFGSRREAWENVRMLRRARYTVAKPEKLVREVA